MPSKPDPYRIPRSARGTNFAKFNHRICMGALVFGTALAVWIDQSEHFRGVKELHLKYLKVDPEIERERKMTIGIFPGRSGETLRRQYDDLLDTTKPNK